MNKICDGYEQGPDEGVCWCGHRLEKHKDWIPIFIKDLTESVNRGKLHRSKLLRIFSQVNNRPDVKCRVDPVDRTKIICDVTITPPNPIDFVHIVPKVTE